MSLLSREQILQVDDAQVQEVQVPEWGGSVRIKALNGTERDAFEASVATAMAGKGVKLNLLNVRAKLVSLAAVDEQGQRLFRDQDVTALGRKNAAALDRVFAVAQRLAGLSEKDVEAITVNFPDTPNGASTSD